MEQKFCNADSRPQIAESEGDCIERTDPHRLVVLRARDQQPSAVVELERLERAVDRVDEPQVADAREGVDGPFLLQVDLAGRLR